MSISLRDSRLQQLVEQMTAGGQKLNQSGVSELIDADGHGYVTDKQVEALVGPF